MGLTSNGKRIGMAAHLERVDFRQSLEDDYQRRQHARCESDEICQAIYPFFDDDMWQEFVDAGPDDNRGFLEYVRAEWYRIAEYMEVLH
jgi:hypothetical protein